MAFITQYGLFLLKTLTIVIAILLSFAGILALKRKPCSKLEIISLNKKNADLSKQMWNETKNTKMVKEKKLKKKEQKEKPSLYVLNFSGDIKASQVEQLRDTLSAILTIATAEDEVVVRLESPGGTVNSYGLAASQLQRVRDRQIPLTVCIDKIAASGGYLMACVANKIIAAPFAIIGSIGVVAQIPNFYRWLKKHDIDVELLTAGEYKRTLTLFTENTEKSRKKFQQDLEKIHDVFRNYVLSNRPELDMEKVATGEHWLAKDAVELNLVDELQTSDDYLNSKIASFNCFEIIVPSKRSLFEKLSKPAMKWLHPWS